MFIYCTYLENQEMESNPLLSEIAKLLPTLRSSNFAACYIISWTILIAFFHFDLLRLTFYVLLLTFLLLVMTIFYSFSCFYVYAERKYKRLELPKTGMFFNNFTFSICIGTEKVYNKTRTVLIKQTNLFKKNLKSKPG